MTAPTPKPQRAGLVELAERCEAATATEQEALLREAGRLVLRDEARLGAFICMLGADAFESAAMALLPEFMPFHLDRDRNDLLCYASIWQVNRLVGWSLKASTPALALCAACLRARAALSSLGGEGR